MRAISENFIKDLKGGLLAYFLKQVKSNRTELCLEIRDRYINIYYKGGNLLRIKEKRNGYEFHFDARYCLNKGEDSNYKKLSSLDSHSVQDYIDNFELMKSEMDSWFDRFNKQERIYQHQLLANNRNVIDIEYAPPKSKKTGNKLNIRLDMLMVNGDKLIIVENKYGVGAISGNAGVKEHYEDICNLLNTDDLYDELIKSVESIAKAKYELGLTDTPIKELDKLKTEILFLFAGCDKENGAIKRAVYSLDIIRPFYVLIINSNETAIDLSNASLYE